MKWGHYVIIVGAAVLVAGIALVVAWALPFASKLQDEASLLRDASLEPGQSQTVSLQVSDAAKSLSIVVSASNDERVNAVLIDPAGLPGINSTFTGANAMSAEPTVPGTYRLVVTNQGDRSTKVDVVFGHIPGIGTGVDEGTFAGVIAGSPTAVAGVIAMVAGAVIVAVQGRHKE